MKSILDRIEGFHWLTGRARRGLDTALAVHAHARPLRRQRRRRRVGAVVGSRDRAGEMQRYHGAYT
ncbi:hypothetical protein FAIPA1_580005 [Frankia sp. AiPs1]